jgi:uncharacterized protein involved in outer membrane biogenesis
MTDATIGSPAARKPRRWLRVLGVVVGVLILLLVVLYFVATSSAFFTGVILPRVSKAMNAQVTVSDASISPFSQVVLHNLKVQATGAEPLVTAAEVRLRYSLMDIVRGNIHVDEVTLASPTVSLVESPDGSNNLDPILKAQAAKPAEQKPPPPAPPAKPGKPLLVDLKKFAITDATVRYVKNYANGKRDLTELSHVNVTLNDLKNGQSAKLALMADIGLDHTNGVLQAKLGGDFTFALAPDLKPGAIQGMTRLEVTRAEGALAQLAAFVSELHVDVTPTEVKGVGLQFLQGKTLLGELRVNGPLDLAKLEGRLNIELASIDKRLLNLAGAAQGLDFGPTTISSTNQLELAKGGSVINARGQFDVSQFQVTRTNQTTPRLDLRKAYDLTVDRGQSTATLRSLTLTGAQNGTPFLKAELTSPMQIAWGNANSAVGDSALTLTVTAFNLADWKPFLGDVVPAGLVNLTAKILTQQGGQQVALDFDSHIDHLSVNAGSNHLSEISITFQASANAANFKQFNLTSCKFEVARENQTLMSASSSGTYDKAADTAGLQFAAQATLARLLQTLPQPDMSISSGTVDLKAHLTQKQKAQSVTGTFALADFTGRFGKNDLRSFGATADFAVDVTPQQIQLRKAAGKLTQGTNVGGSFDLTATYDLTKKTAGLTAKLVDVNENGVGPFLEPMLADKKLVSVAINASATAQYDPQGASAMKGDLQVTNLVVKDPAGQFPATPLQARMLVDASVQKQVADLRQFQVTLTPTTRATNQVQLSGKVDMSQTNAIQGNLKLAADSLDLTTYYDLFMGQKKAPATAAATAPAQPAAPAPPPAAAPGGADQEPAAMKLPLHNFTAEAAIGRCYLHEVDIANFQATVKIDGGHVVVNPFKLTLNGAPASSTVDLDLGVPGWKYDVSLSGQAIPLAPLVNSFQPERAGQVGGTVTAQGKVSGAGITGPSLQKNLAAQFDMSTTNLNFSVVNIKSALLKSVVNVVAGIPELIRNPAGGLTSLLGNVTGGLVGTSGGLADDLQRSPINAIIASLTVGTGRVDLKQATVQSAAFQADATGTITLNAVLTNSAIQIPVSVALSQAIARRMNLANAATNTAYVKLPDFLTEQGTIGQPKSKVDYVALAGAVGKSVTGFVPAAGQTASGLLGNILGTKSTTATNAPASTNQPPAKSLLKGFLGR